MKATAQTKQHSKRNQGTVGLQDWEGREAGAAFVSGQSGDGLLALHPQGGDLLLLLSAGEDSCRVEGPVIHSPELQGQVVLTFLFWAFTIAKLYVRRYGGYDMTNYISPLHPQGYEVLAGVTCQQVSSNQG